MKWKTNGKQSAAHVFIEEPSIWGGKAICGARIPGFFEVDSQKRTEVKRITCPKCKNKR